MKSKWKIAVALAVVVLMLICVLAGCKKDEPNNGGFTQKEPEEISFSVVYQAALDLGYTGTLEELIEAFKGDSAYQIAVANGYKGNATEWLKSLKGATGADGKTPFIGANGNWWIGDIDCGITATGKDGNGILKIEHNFDEKNPEIY